MRLRIHSLLLLSLALGACAVQMRIKDAKIPNGDIATLHASSPIAVRPRIVDGPKRKIAIAGPDVTVDEDQFSSELVNRVVEELRSQSVPVDPDASRSIELQVVRVSLQPDRTIYCVIDFNRRLGDGELRGLQSRAKNSNYETACGEALSRAVVDTLNDSTTRSYLEGN